LIIAKHGRRWKIKANKGLPFGGFQLCASCHRIKDQEAVMKNAAKVPMNVEIKKQEAVMKKAVQFAVVVVIGLAFMTLTGCAGTPKSGFLGDYYSDLGPGPKEGVEKRWIKPGVDFSKYNKLMIDTPVFYYADDSEDKGIDLAATQELTDAFNQELINALKDKYPMVTEPGPDVARLRIALTNVKKSKPVISTVSSIVPVGIAVSFIKKGTTGSWSGSGATSAEFMALDSTTNDVIAVAADTQTAGYFDRFSKLGSAKDAFKFWAERIAAFLDAAKASKQ
jgi:hypothetical protein